MIFSKTNCPICLSPLVKEDIYEDAQYISVLTVYACPTRVQIFNWLDTPTNAHHYIFRDKPNPSVSMTIPPFGLEHLNNETHLYTVSPTDSPKYITTLPLLDLDYHADIQDTLKLYLTFS